MSAQLVLRKQWFVSSKTELIQNHYIFQQQLGSGAYGKVFKAISIQTNRVCAIKMIQKSRVKDYKTFQIEFNILRVLDHPNILKIQQAFQTDSICYLVMQLCEGGELFQHIIEQKCLNQAYAADIMRKLLSAIAYCHQQGICHRDLKPQNILFYSKQSNSDIQLIDFGLAKQHTEQTIMHSLKGTPYYIAPEVLEGNYTDKIDCWSLGVLLYIMLAGTPPFNGRNNQQILLKVYNGSFNFRPIAFQNVSNLGKDIISRLLIKDPDLRLNAKQAFQHPWVAGLAPLPMIPISSQMYQDMANFVQSQKLKRASIMYIASRLSQKDIQNLKRIFIALDSDGNGLLSKAELIQGFQQSGLGVNLDQNYLNTLWDMMDTNLNGKIDYTEFITGCLHNQQYCDQGYLRSAFEYFDQDKNGCITVEELRLILRDNEMSLHMGEDQLQQMIREVDIDGNGSIDYNEFIQMMRSTGFNNQNQL